MDVSVINSLSAQLDSIVDRAQNNQTYRTRTPPAQFQQSEASDLQTAVYGGVQAITSDEAQFSVASALLQKARDMGDERSFMETAVGQVNQVVNELGISLTFKFRTTETGQNYVEVRNKFDGTLVKTIPPEELLDVRDKMRETLKGLLVNEKE